MSELSLLPPPGGEGHRCLLWVVSADWALPEILVPTPKLVTALRPRAVPPCPLRPSYASRLPVPRGSLGAPVVILSGASVVVSGAQRVSQAGKQSSNGRGVPCSAP